MFGVYCSGQELSQGAGSSGEFVSNQEATAYNWLQVSDRIRDVDMREAAEKGLFWVGKSLINIDEVYGSPYYNDSFEKVEIINNQTKDTLGAYGRYRIYDDLFEVKVEKDSALQGLKRSPDVMILLQGNKFVYFDQFPVEIDGESGGYFQEMVPSDKNSIGLYQKMTESFSPGRKATSGYDTDSPGTFRVKHYFFLKTPKGFVYLKKPKRRRIASKFPDHKKQLNNFIKKEKLKFSRKHRAQDLKELVEYYNSL